jgi:hypothetical protein
MIAVLTASMLAGAAFAQQQPGAAAGSQRTVSQAQQAKPLNINALRGYSVVLVIGDMQSAGSTDSVPAAARKALADMQAFLPYRRYQLLDAGWMTCCGGGRSSPIVGRLRGPEERDYSYVIDTLGGDNGRLTVRFSLREGDGGPPAVSITNATAGGRVAPQQPTLSDTARAEYSRQLYEAQKERDESDIQQRQAKKMYDVGTMPETEYQIARRRFQLAASRVQELERVINPGSMATPVARGSLLDSTFSIAIGETIVIGTSRLKGDQALIALLTAAGTQGASR